MTENKKQIPEAAIESKLLYKLKELGYSDRTDIKNVKDIENNIKKHLERLNNKLINEEEFETYVLNKIKNMDVYNTAKQLRDVFIIKKPNRENIRLNCFNLNNIEENIFEFSNQIRYENKYVNISDVTIFINGFPICQIELKRSGCDIYEAFNQILRYKKENSDLNINKFIQIYVISNKETTKYFSNNIIIKKEFVFPWSDGNNSLKNNLFDFSESFFEKITLFKLITKYMVIEESKIIKILRPYQYYAVENIINHINATNELNDELVDLDERSKKLNGYIFHATGSGKTLTSFKLCELLMKDSKVSKVIFLVDRLDLNAQTIKEFNKFSDGDLDETENTNKLEQQLKNSNTKLIVTTIHKLNRLLEQSNFIKNNKSLLNSNVVFIIDECHRSQFGEMHKNIRINFCKSRLIGFTGTPIIRGNENDKMQLTSDMFGQEIHKYMMINAIEDLNVLPFKIEYVGGLKNKLSSENDIDVEGIDTDEFYKSDLYISKVSDFIYKTNDNLSRKKKMKSMLVCSSIENAIKYYWYFRKNFPDLNIASLFSFIDNDKNIELDKHSKHELEKIIEDYNKIYNKEYSTKNFKDYSLSIQSDLINNLGAINMIIVVKMLTTGFNCQPLNTIYIDRKLKTHELIQTISRVNRVYIPSKTRANVISFRTFKNDVDYAIRLYNDKELVGFIDKCSLDKILTKINKLIDELLVKWPTANDAHNIVGDETKKNFISYMKQINKLLNIASSFIEYDPSLINITEDGISEYRSVQRIFSNRIKAQIDKSSILEDIDFEIEIIASDDVDVDHILNLIETIPINADDFEKRIDSIIAKIRNSSLKSKLKLIEEFIQQWKDNKNHDININDAFAEFKVINVSEKIKEFADHYGIESEIIKKIYKKYQLEKKNIQSYSEELRNSESLKIMKYSERNELLQKIKEFIVDLGDGLEIYQWSKNEYTNNRKIGE